MPRDVLRGTLSLLRAVCAFAESLGGGLDFGWRGERYWKVEQRCRWSDGLPVWQLRVHA
jgi:hypothetical protein